jgi:hypothetical protein
MGAFLIDLLLEWQHLEEYQGEEQLWLSPRAVVGSAADDQDRVDRRRLGILGLS